MRKIPSVTVDRETLVLIDASCLFTAIQNPHGGSGFIIDLCHKGYVLGAVSQVIIAEAGRNLFLKSIGFRLPDLDLLIAQSNLFIVPVPKPDHFEASLSLVNANDAHVLASALFSNAHFILTLDRRFQREVVATGLISAVTPAEFINIFLPAHPAFKRFR